MRRLPSARHAINTVRDRRGLAIIVASRGRPRNVHPNKYQPNRKKSRSQTLSSPFLDLICVQLPPPSLSLSPFPYKSSCYRRVVAYADGRRGVATILFIRRRKPPASPWRLREREAERSGAGRWHGQNACNDGRKGASGNSFRILYPASATRQLIHPPLPLPFTTSVNEDFISILGGV